MSTTAILNNVINRNNVLNESLTLEKSPTNTNFLSFINRHTDLERMPVNAKKGSWEQFDYGEYDCIEKTYDFKSVDHLLYFVNEVVLSSEKHSHHPILNIDHMLVNVKLYTKDFNTVTEADTLMSSVIDEIFEDIFYIEKL